MAENITVTGQEAYFNEDAKFFKDVYVYGKLYYDFDLDTDNLVLDNLTVNNALSVNGTSNLNNLSVIGISTFDNYVSFGSTVSVASTATFQTDVNILGSLNVKNIIVGIATVQERFELTNEDGTNYLVGFATGARAGKVGIGSTLPDQKLDVGGAIRIQTEIYDSVNYPGINGYYLSRDAGGIRWVAANPTQLQSIFIQNEGVNVAGASSFSTLNFIGTRSGGDLVNATVNAFNSSVVDIDIIDHWTKNASGIHTTVNVGINVASPAYGLDVGADAYFRNQVEFESAVLIDAGLIVTGFTTGTISTSIVSGFAQTSGVSTNIRTTATSTNQEYFLPFVENSITTGIETVRVDSGIKYNPSSNALRVDGNLSIGTTSLFQNSVLIDSGLIVTGFTTGTISTSIFTNSAGFAQTAGVSTHIRTTSTVTDQDYYLPFVENSVTTDVEIVRVDSGIKYNPSSNALRVDGNLSIGTTSLFQNTVLIDSGLIISGFATGTISTSIISGFAQTAGVSTHIRTTATSTNQDYFLTFVENSISAGIETVRVDSGIKYNPSSNALRIDGGLSIGTTSLFQNIVLIDSGLIVTGFTTGTISTSIVSGFAQTAGLSTHIRTTATSTNQDYYLPFVENSVTTGIETVRVDSGIKYNPGSNALRVDGGLSIGTTSLFQNTVLIDSGLIISGFATGTISTSIFANSAGFAQTSGVSTNIRTTATSTNQDYYLPFVENSVTTDVETVRVDGGIKYNPSSNALSIDGTLKVGIGGSVITTTGIGSVGFGSVSPTREVDFQKDVRFQQAIYDTNDNVGFRSEYYQVPRNVLTTVGVDTAGSIIGGRFYDAANLIRLNLDFIANEAIGFLTSTSYKNPAFVVPTGNPGDCKDDIKDILKAITYDITRGGNSRSVGAGLSYYSGVTLQHITGTDINGYSVKDATIVAITTAAQIARYVINNLTPPISYQGIGSVSLIRDLTLQEDPNVGFNTDPGGCANVVSAITVCAGIVTTIIGNGPSAAPNVTNPDGKIVWAPAGADSRNIIYVSKYGNDDNNGRTEGAAKLTIGAAAAIAQPGDTIMVRSGVYAENNPVGLRTDVTVSGQDLRLVTIYPQNNDDVFYVRRGCLIENLSFAYSKDPYDDAAPISITGAAVAFPPPAGIGSARSGFLDPGPCNEGPSGRWRSPYIRNCTNFMTNSTGMKIDGNHVNAAFTGTNNLGQDLKCMVCDSFTQYNQNGIGVSITNNGYAQLVSIFTINSNIAIYCDTGGSCDLTNSNSSFGNYGLYANGVGDIEFTGITTGADVIAEQDTYTFTNVRDTLNNIRKPFDGQALFFKINLADYNDVGGATGIVTAPLRTVRSIKVTNGGSGYSETAPPNVTISTPGGPESILAEVSANVSAAGTIGSIDVIASGRNFLPDQAVTVTISGAGGATAEAIMDPIYYTVNTATEPTNAGLTTVTFNEFIPYSVGAGTSVEFRRISRIVASNITFEYVGSGVDINIANPFQGGVPVPENEIVAINGGQVPFTSTDQKGNFRIGEGLVIDQNTSTISGRDFNRAIQANLTPLILALGG